MNKEGNPELTKSWVIVDQKPDEDKTTRVQEVTDNESHVDSDTDSISVISESGCSYKTDEEEAPIEKEEVHHDTAEPSEPQVEEVNEVVEQPEPEIVEPPPPCIVQNVENKGTEKLLYFATSAACAIILIGVSIAVQQYFQGASDVNNVDPDQLVFPHVQNLKNEELVQQTAFKLKRKNQFKFDQIEKVAKPRRDKSEDDDLRSNNKPNKNRNHPLKCNKDNCDSSNENDKTTENYDQKIKELKMKENYLKEKEKFLIEKEHDLMKKEIKLNKEKQTYEKNKNDKKSFKRDYKDSEEDSTEKKKFKHAKNEKKYKRKEEKKYNAQKTYKYGNEDKKKNISGQWYTNLHEARDNMRQKKRSGFKRSKAHWYFQWMVDRARLRVK